MAIIPDTYREMSLDIGRRPDTSGVDGNAAIYEAISNLASNTQSIATKVAADMHDRETTLEAADTYAQYDKRAKQRIAELENDPNLKLYKNPKAVEDAYLTELKTQREQLLNSTTSWKAKQKLEAHFAGKDSEDALRFLAFKERRLKQENEQVSNEMLSALKQETTEYNTTTVDTANAAYKRFVSRYSGVFNGNIPPQLIDRTVIQAADDSALSAIDIHLAKGELIHAASAILGKESALKLYEISKRNYRDGTPLVSDPELQKVLRWKPETEMLKKVSPNRQQQLMDMILQASSRKHAEDNSLWKRQKENVTNAALDGTATAAETDRALIDLDRSLPETADKVEALDLITARLTSTINDQARKVRSKYNLAEKADFNRYFKDSMPAILDELSKSGVIKNSLLKLGDGNEEIGRATLQKPSLIKDLQEKLYTNYMAQEEKDRNEFAKDPIKASVSMNPISQVKQRMINKYFAYGKIAGLANANPNEIVALREALIERRNNARTSMGGLSPVQKLLTEEEATDLKATLNMQGSDSGQFVQLTNSMRVLGTDLMMDIADQLGVKGLYSASLFTDPALIQQTGLALKDLAANKKAFKYDNEENIMELNSDIYKNEDFKKYSSALTKGDTTRAKAVVDDQIQTVQALTLQLMSNGVDKDAALKESVKRITDSFDIIQTNTWSEPDSHTILPKGSNINEDEFIGFKTDFLKDPRVWENFHALVIPDEVMKVNEASGGKAVENFIKKIVNGLDLLPSTDGNNLTLGYIDKDDPLKAWKKIYFTDIEGQKQEFTYSLNDLRADTAAWSAAPFTLKDPTGLRDRNLAPSEERKAGVGIVNRATEKRLDLSKTVFGRKMRSSINTFVNHPSNSYLEKLKYFEGADQKTFNEIKTAKRSKTLYGGMTLGALQDVDTFIFKTTPLKSLDEYKNKFVSITVANQYFEGYLKHIRQLMVKDGYAIKMDDFQRNIAQHIAFSTGYKGSKTDLKIFDRIINNDIDSILPAIKASPKDRENYFSEKTGKLNERGQWLERQLQLIKKK